MLAAGWINLNLPSFSRYTTCSQWKSATRKVAAFSGEGFRVVLNRGVPTFAAGNYGINYPAAECDTVNQWKCKDSWEIKRVSIIRCWWLTEVFVGRRENSWNYQKWHFSEWLWYTTGFDSGCWMIVACWDAIPAFWFFVLVICKGMLFYLKE